MVKHTQTIRRQIADELFECVWPFCKVIIKSITFEMYKIDWYVKRDWQKKIGCTNARVIKLN